MNLEGRREKCVYTDYPKWTLSVPCGGFGISPSWGQSDFSFESWFPISKTRELNGGRGSSPPPPYMRQCGQRGGDGACCGVVLL